MDQDDAETLRTSERNRRLCEFKSCRLDVVEGPDKGRSIEYDGRSLRIGKSSQCDLKLSDESVSRCHILITLAQDGFTLEDQGSTNGTEVNGVRIKTALLDPGARIKLGMTVLRFSMSSELVRVPPLDDEKLCGLLGRSEPMRRAMGLIRKVAPMEITCVLHAETGSGKELAARAVHELSSRCSRPFVVFDCSNVNRDLMGSELFGHAKGAFTGAVAAREGAFDQAHQGTLFLDEIGELPLDVQARLLGVLQRREVQPLGAQSAHPVDVRVVAATHRDLEAMVKKGEFRADLYFRLAVITIELPPLRERLEDIPLLAEAILDELAPSTGYRAELTPEARTRLLHHAWPGNVRELRNVLQRAAVLCAGAQIGQADLVLPDLARETAAEADPAPEAGASLTLQDVEKRAIISALARHRDNKSSAARELGIPLSTFKRRLQELGLSRPAHKRPTGPR